MKIEVLLELIELIITQKDKFGYFIENLVKKNFMVDEEDLLAATQIRQFELVRFVLRSGVKPTLESFQYAAEHEFFELCRLFVEFGSREILSTPELERELRIAIFVREESAINLINRGVDPMTDDNYAIKAASQNGKPKIIQLLLEHGADPTAEDNFAIKTASARGRLEIVRLLLNNNSKYKVNPKADNKWAIKNASGYNRRAIIVLLKQYS
jgi:ankyrin repeat protein